MSVKRKYLKQIDDFNLKFPHLAFSAEQHAEIARILNLIEQDFIKTRQLLKTSSQLIRDNHNEKKSLESRIQELKTYINILFGGITLIVITYVTFLYLILRR